MSAASRSESKLSRRWASDVTVLFSYVLELAASVLRGAAKVRLAPRTSMLCGVCGALLGTDQLGAVMSQPEWELGAKWVLSFNVTSSDTEDRVFGFAGGGGHGELPCLQ